ncbi:hypothetical protein ACH9L7_19825 (plasmid) [Haloferax sp. S1W]|uniref:hypothetical protein n=1 Tax=Haloferax sp. S1W TaxID=3377110 RepID=UPI0037CB13FA
MAAALSEVKSSNVVLKGLSADYLVENTLFSENTLDNVNIGRREFLATSAVAGTGLIAGCGSQIEASPGENSDKDVPAPSVDIPDGWEVTTPNSKPIVFVEGKDLGVSWTAVGHTKLYENKKLRERIKQETFGKIDQTLMVAFASRIDFFSSIAHLGTSFQQETINSEVRSQMRDRMTEFGLTEVTYKGEVQREEETNPSKFHKWTAYYPVDEIPVNDVDIPNVEKDSFTIGGKNLKIGGLAGVWKEGKSLLAAGGVYPADYYNERQEWDVSGAIHLSLDIEMGFQPTNYNHQIKSIMDSVDP